MTIRLRALGLVAGALTIAAAAFAITPGPERTHAQSTGGGYQGVSVEGNTESAYIVYRAVDRDGFCDAAASGAVSLHPVLTDAPNDTIVNEASGLPNPRHTVDFLIDGGDGIILETSSGVRPADQSALGIPTYSLLARASDTSFTTFAPAVEGAVDECQAWVKVASASGQPVNVLVIVHADEGDLAFDRVVNFGPDTTSQQLVPGWNLVTWSGPDGMPPEDALGGAAGREDISESVSAIVAWDGTLQEWSAYYPGSADVPGANDLAALEQGQAYWVAVSATGPIAWQIPATS